MADTVSTRILEQGERNLIVQLTNLSDGTGETGVVKVDASTLSPIPDDLVIDWVQWDISGMNVQIDWDATANVTALLLGAGQGVQDYRIFGGVSNNAGAGKTGDMLVTTIGAASNASYNITLGLRKKYDGPVVS